MWHQKLKYITLVGFSSVGQSEGICCGAGELVGEVGESLGFCFPPLKGKGNKSRGLWDTHVGCTVCPCPQKRRKSPGVLDTKEGGNPQAAQCRSHERTQE